MAHLYLGISTVLVVLLLVVIFVAQNSGSVPIHFFIWRGHLALGLALLLSAVVGGLVVVLLSALRIIQLRRRDHSKQHRPPGRHRWSVRRGHHGPSADDELPRQTTSGSSATSST
ncbi:MAG TPA: lipopolysaccharide assembly protein LapA domain-containing protein [Acidimicrobiales bacterium]|nr:lipopolysaccharide assembly protein LapA domain-containing protein [Acidimicrobiales bacterium]